MWNRSTTINPHLPIIITWYVVPPLGVWSNGHGVVHGGTPLHLPKPHSDGHYQSLIHGDGDVVHSGTQLALYSI